MNIGKNLGTLVNNTRKAIIQSAVLPNAFMPENQFNVELFLSGGRRHSKMHTMQERMSSSSYKNKMIKYHRSI